MLPWLFSVFIGGVFREVKVSIGNRFEFCKKVMDAAVVIDDDDDDDDAT